MRNKIDWLNHGLEFLVVLIGILIAFQLNNYATTKEQNKTIAIHLTQILEETEFNKKNFENGIAYAQSNLAKLDTIFRLFGEKGNNEKINSLSIELLNLGGVYIRKNAYLNLIESGDIKFMKDFEQKSKIIDLYEFYKWVESFNEISFNLYSSDYYPYIRDNFDLVGGTTQSDDIYEAKLFKNVLGAYYRTSKNKLEKYEECLSQIKEYLGEKD